MVRVKGLFNPRWFSAPSNVIGIGSGDSPMGIQGNNINSNKTIDTSITSQVISVYHL